MFSSTSVPEDAINGIEFRRQSFIVKVWLEPPEKDGGQARWRGHITHVPTGERKYVDDLDGITAFIAKHLQQMGPRAEFRRELRGWLRWINRCRERSTKTKGREE